MHARGCSELQDATAALRAMRRRRQAECGAKGAAEGLDGFVTRVEGDRGDGLSRILQLQRGSLQPKPPHVLADGLAHQRRKDAMEVIVGKTGDAGQNLERQRRVQVLLNMDEDAAQPVLILGRRSAAAVHPTPFPWRRMPWRDAGCLIGLALLPGRYQGSKVVMATCAAGSVRSMSERTAWKRASSAPASF